MQKVYSIPVILKYKMMTSLENISIVADTPELAEEEVKKFWEKENPEIDMKITGEPKESKIIQPNLYNQTKNP